MYCSEMHGVDKLKKNYSTYRNRTKELQTVAYAVHAIPISYQCH
jgi:hypothetical protein